MIGTLAVNGWAAVQRGGPGRAAASSMQALVDPLLAVLKGYSPEEIQLGCAKRGAQLFSMYFECLTGPHR